MVLSLILDIPGVPNPPPRWIFITLHSKVVNFWHHEIKHLPQMGMIPNHVNLVQRLRNRASITGNGVIFKGGWIFAPGWALKGFGATSILVRCIVYSPLMGMSTFFTSRTVGARRTGWNPTVPSQYSSYKHSSLRRAPVHSFFFFFFFFLCHNNELLGGGGQFCLKTAKTASRKMALIML